MKKKARREEGIGPRRKGGEKQLTRKSGDKCKCGGQDHRRVTSSKCPWQGQSKEEVAANWVLAENNELFLVKNQNCGDENSKNVNHETTGGSTLEHVETENSTVDPTTTADPTMKQVEIIMCVPIVGVQSTSKCFSRDLLVAGF